MMIISQAFQIAQTMMKFNSASATAIVSFIALFNTLGRLASGTMSDKLGSIGVLKISLFSSALAGMVLSFCKEESVIVFYVCVAIIGFCFGGIMGVYPGFTAKEFGRTYNSMNYGIMFVGFALAGFIGPITMNFIYANSGKYQPAFLVSALLSVIGFILIWGYDKLKNNQMYVKKEQRG